MKLMHIFFVLLSLFLVSRCDAQSDEAIDMQELNDVIANSSLARQPGGAAAIARALREKRNSNGCDPNVCFAIDGSRQLGAADFNLQKDFLAIVSAIVGTDERAHFSGVQYGLRTRAIRAIRGNADEFLIDVENTRWLRSRRSFIGGGVAYCAQQLRRRRGEPSKIVVFGDGRSNYGGLRGRLSPVALAEEFRAQSPGNAVCTVAVGFSRTNLFRRIVGGRNDLVLKVTEWHRVLEILRELVKDICETDTLFRR